MAIATAALACSGTLAACGGGGNDSGGATKGPSSGAGGGSALAKQSPRAVINTVADELAKVRSYRLAGTQKDKDGAQQVVADVAADGSLKLTLKMGKGTADLIAVASKPGTYMRADRAFWLHSGSAKAAQLFSDRWVRLPPGQVKDIDDLVDQARPKTLAMCLRKAKHGTVKNLGVQDLNGHKVVVLDDDGNAPGDAPGKLYVAATGRPLPVLVTQLGRQRPGGRPDPRCGDDPKDTTTSSTTTISRYDQPVRVTAPAGAIDLGKLQGSGGGAVA
jgi:hypothetical protein